MYSTLNLSLSSLSSSSDLFIHSDHNHCQRQEVPRFILFNTVLQLFFFILIFEREQGKIIHENVDYGLDSTLLRPSIPARDLILIAIQEKAQLRAFYTIDLSVQYYEIACKKKANA